MVLKRSFILISLLLLGLLLSGCPKKVVIIPPPEKRPYENPMVRLLDAFSSADSVQARASIRVNTVRSGQEMNFLLNGFVIYQKPDKLRILGYLPIGTGVFDALYLGGEIYILSPLQKKAYTGEISEVEEGFEKAGVKVSTEKTEGRDIPTRIRIEVEKKETSVELRLKDTTINSSLPEDSFQWVVPAGVQVIPLTKLLKVKNPG